MRFLKKSRNLREREVVLQSSLDIQSAKRRGRGRNGSASFVPTQSQRLTRVSYPNRNYYSCFDGRLPFVLIENDYLPRNIHNPIATKASAATFLRIFWGMTAIRPSPKRTPTSVTRHKARDAPMNTDQGSFVLEVIMMAANCVLSPSSARKIVPKVVRKTFQSIALPLQS